MKRILTCVIAATALSACGHSNYPQSYAQQCNPNVEQCPGYVNQGYQNGGHSDAALAGAAILGAGAGALAHRHFANNNGYHANYGYQGGYPAQTVVHRTIVHNHYYPSAPVSSAPAAAPSKPIPSFAQVYRQNRPPRGR